jgi:hypothetical protein
MGVVADVGSAIEGKVVGGGRLVVFHLGVVVCCVL